jgi:hypothetical protein
MIYICLVIIFVLFLYFPRKLEHKYWYVCQVRFKTRTRLISASSQLYASENRNGVIDWACNNLDEALSVFNEVTTNYPEYYTIIVYGSSNVIKTSHRNELVLNILIKKHLDYKNKYRK